MNLLFRFCLLGNGSWMKFDDLSAIVSRATFVAAGMYFLLLLLLCVDTDRLEGNERRLWR